MNYQKKSRQFHWEIFQHFPYSLGITPSNYLLYRFTNFTKAGYVYSALTTLVLKMPISIRMEEVGSFDCDSLINLYFSLISKDHTSGSGSSLSSIFGPLWFQLQSPTFLFIKSCQYFS